jgi:uncharacterized protein involved in exopolysaccharide biosynthesis
MDDDIDLGRYLGVLWHWRYLIAVVVLASAVIAGLYGTLVPPTYETKAMVLVAKPPLQVGSVPSGDNQGLQIGTLYVSDLPAETLVAFSKSPMVLQVVAQQLGGTGRGSKGPGVAFLANSVRSTNLVELRTRGRDPVLAAKAANIWAEVVAAQSEALFSTEAQQSFTFFERQLRETTDQFNVASRAQRDFNARSQVALLQARVTSVTEQISSYQSRLIDISVARRRAEVELSQADAQLRLQPRTLTLSKSITTDPLLHQAATQGRTRGDFSELSKLQLKTEEVNPVYIHIAEAKSDLAVRVASLRAEQGRVATVITQLTRTLELLRGQLASQQLTQTELTRSVENARQVYGVLLQRREEARLASTSQSGSARLVAAAIVPDFPVAPRRSLSILVGLALGLMAGAVLAFVMEHITAASQGSVERPASVASAEVPSIAEH